MSSLDTLLRKIVLAAASRRLVSRLFQKYGMKLGVRRFVAAETVEDTVDAIKRLNGDGLMATLDYLGESVTDRSAAIDAAQAIKGLFQMIHDHRLDANVSVKLTQLGLNIDEHFCLQNMDEIVAEAVKYNNFVRIDMEDSGVTQLTIDLFEKLLDKYGKDRVGLVIQSYLYRSAKDAKRLAQRGVNLRIVKGAYNEPRTVAYPAKRDVDESYRSLVQNHLARGCYTAIATHDTRIIKDTLRFIEQRNIPRTQFEFQMLYGIASGLQRELADEGYRVRVYTPFGRHWYPYFTRRIAERPANMLFVLKGVLRK
jgi:proline dehydrogenase